jgi:hypothetical protein
LKIFSASGRSDPLEMARIRREPIEAAKVFIDLEISAVPEQGGPLTSILKITRDNAQWIEGYRGVCPAFQPMHKASPKHKK